MILKSWLALIILLAMCNSAFGDYYSLMSKGHMDKAASLINEGNGWGRPILGAFFQASSPDRIEIVRLHSGMPYKSSSDNYGLSIVYEHLYTSFFPSFNEGWKLKEDNEFVLSLGTDDQPYSKNIYKGNADLAYLFLSTEKNKFERIAQLVGVDLIYPDEIESFELPIKFYEMLSTYSYKAYCGASSCDRPSPGLRLPEGGFEYTESKEKIVFPIVYPVRISTPSYNCEKASTRVEKLICDSKLLSKLDRELADYFSVHKVTLKTPYDDRGYKQFLKSHVAWLKSRDACFDSNDYYSPLECLVIKYQEQIHFLRIDSSVRPWGDS